MIVLGSCLLRIFEEKTKNRTTVFPLSIYRQIFAKYGHKQIIQI